MNLNEHVRIFVVHQHHHNIIDIKTSRTTTQSGRKNNYRNSIKALSRPLSAILTLGSKQYLNKLINYTLITFNNWHILKINCILITVRYKNNDYPSHVRLLLTPTFPDRKGKGKMSEAYRKRIQPFRI